MPKGSKRIWTKPLIDYVECYCTTRSDDELCDDLWQIYGVTFTRQQVAGIRARLGMVRQRGRATRSDILERREDKTKRDKM